MIPRDFDDQIAEPTARLRPTVYAIAPSYFSRSIPKREWVWDGVSRGSKRVGSPASEYVALPFRPTQQEGFQT